MNEQVIKRFERFANANNIQINIDSVLFHSISLTNKSIFEFVKGQNKYIRKSIAENPGDIPVVGASLDNQCIYNNVTPLSEKDVINKPSVSFNKDNAKGSRAFFRNYPFVMDRHHIAILANSEIIDPEYLYYYLDNFLISQRYGWGENVATVEAVQLAEIPVPNYGQEDSLSIQKILVKFIRYEQTRFGNRLKTLTDLYGKFEQLEKLIVPRTLSKEPDAMKRLERFIIKNKSEIDLNDFYFTRKPVKDCASFPSVGRVTGGVDINQEKYNLLPQEERENFAPLVSGTISNNQVSGYINKERLDDKNLSPASCLSWTRINATIFFKQEQAVCINDDSFVLTEKEQETDLHYLYYTIPLEASKKGFGWGNKAGLNRIQDLEIEIPDDTDTFNSLELQILLSSFFKRYIAEIGNKKSQIKKLEQLIPRYQEEFVNVFFTSLKAQAHAR